MLTGRSAETGRQPGEGKRRGRGDDVRVAIYATLRHARGVVVRTI